LPDLFLERHLRHQIGDEGLLVIQQGGRSPGQGCVTRKAGYEAKQVQPVHSMPFLSGAILGRRGRLSGSTNLQIGTRPTKSSLLNGQIAAWHYDS
jgi:hypothetical protein